MGNVLFAHARALYTVKDIESAPKSGPEECGLDPSLLLPPFSISGSEERRFDPSLLLPTFSPSGSEECRLRTSLLLPTFSPRLEIRNGTLGPSPVRVVPNGEEDLSPVSTPSPSPVPTLPYSCLLYTSDAADE